MNIKKPRDKIYGLYVILLNIKEISVLVSDLFLSFSSWSIIFLLLSIRLCGLAHKSE